MHDPTEAERIEFDEFEMVTDYQFSTGDIAPVNLNREVSEEIMKNVLDDINADWTHIEKTNGDGRTVIHYYELIVPYGGSFKLEHHQCGLESAGNNVKFEGGTPDSLMWNTVVGINERITQKRREEALESMQHNMYSYEFLAKVSLDAVSNHEESVRDLEEEDFLGLKMKVDRYREKISDVVSTRTVLKQENMKVEPAN